MKALQYAHWVLKALISGGIAFTEGMILVTLGETAAEQAITTNEWWVVIGGTLAALSLVFGVSNGPKPTSNV